MEDPPAYGQVREHQDGTPRSLFYFAEFPWGFPPQSPSQGVWEDGDPTPLSPLPPGFPEPGSAHLWLFQHLRLRHHPLEALRQPAEHPRSCPAGTACHSQGAHPAPPSCPPTSPRQPPQGPTTPSRRYLSQPRTHSHPAHPPDRRGLSLQGEQCCGNVGELGLLVPPAPSSKDQ